MLLAVCPKLRIFYVASSFSKTQNGGENKTKKKNPDKSSMFRSFYFLPRRYIFHTVSSLINRITLNFFKCVSRWNRRDAIQSSHQRWGSGV